FWVEAELDGELARDVRGEQTIVWREREGLRPKDGTHPPDRDLLEELRPELFIGELANEPLLRQGRTVPLPLLVRGARLGFEPLVLRALFGRQLVSVITRADDERREHVVGDLDAWQRAAVLRGQQAAREQSIDDDARFDYAHRFQRGGRILPRDRFAV